MPIRLVCVNVERSKHLERVLPFLAKEQPDVACIQELCARDIPKFEAALGLPCRYGPVSVHPADAPEVEPVLTGVGIFARGDTTLAYYKGSEHAARTPPVRSRATDAPLVGACIRRDNHTFRILTTHFTWTPDGSPDDVQRADIQSLVAMLAHEEEFVLCGDFNAPRGGEIFAELASRYADNIPTQYATSIDVTLHKRGKERGHELADKMVDGLFTTPEYRAQDVELHFGISDHAAVTARIARV